MPATAAYRIPRGWNRGHRIVVQGQSQVSPRVQRKPFLDMRGAPGHQLRQADRALSEQTTALRFPGVYFALLRPVAGSPTCAILRQRPRGSQYNRESHGIAEKTRGGGEANSGSA